jgi:hypothetical protein
MKSLIKRYNRRMAQEATQREAHDIVRAQWSEQCRKADISILYALHNVFGFGAIRCRRFYHAMIENHFQMCEDFQCKGDDSHYWVMEKRLKDAGIDVDELRREADEMAEKDGCYAEKAVSNSN